jgi:hypothetical protein
MRLIGSSAVPMLRFALAVLFMAALVFAQSAVTAFRSHPLPSSGVARSSGAMAVVVVPPSSSEDLLDDAVAVDPFQPNREPAPLRFGEKPDSSSTTQQGTTIVAQSVRLLGTVIERHGGAASFVVCQLDGAPPRVVHAGERLGSYRLRSIAQGSAVFESDNGTRLELRVLKTGT